MAILAQESRFRRRSIQLQGLRRKTRIFGSLGRVTKGAFSPTFVVNAELGEVVRDGPFWLKGAADEVEVDRLPGKSAPKTGG